VEEEDDGTEEEAVNEPKEADGNRAPIALTLKHLYASCVGYLVGCGWFLWSVLTFQVGVSLNGDSEFV
jgi:hypothetical protein